MNSDIVLFVQEMRLCLSLRFVHLRPVSTVVHVHRFAMRERVGMHFRSANKSFVYALVTLRTQLANCALSFSRVYWKNRRMH